MIPKGIVCQFYRFARIPANNQLLINYKYIPKLFVALNPYKIKTLTMQHNNLTFRTVYSRKGREIMQETDSFPK
jgi:hypothetical protein